MEIVIARILNDWKTECNLNETFRFKYERKSKKLMIFASRIGGLIGGGGELFNKYNQILKDEGVDEIEFVEVNSYEI